MAVVTILDGTNQLRNVSELIDRFCDDLVTNRGWVNHRDTGLAGALGDTIERWIEKPSADTVNGDDIIVGMRREFSSSPTIGIGRDMEIAATKETFAVAANSVAITNITQASQAVVTANAHGYLVGDDIIIENVLGMTEINGQTARILSRTTNTFNLNLNSSAFTAYASGGDAEYGFQSMRGIAVGDDGPNDRADQPAPVNRFPAGPFLRAWFLTPDDTSPTSTDHQYAYCVVEVSVGVYRSFGFGESIKLGTWDGGVFYLGNWMDDDSNPSSSGHFNGFASCNATPTTSGAAGYSAIQLKQVLFGIDPASTLDDNSNGWMRVGFGIRSGNISSAGGRNGVLLPSWDMVGGSALQSSPSPFSGNTFRSPIRYWVHITDNTDDGDIAPMCEIPDVFACNIRDFNPGDTVVDDTESFLVVPTISKQSSAPSSGNAGFLIKNGGL